MRSYRKAITALVLAIVFSASVYADEGVLHTDRTPPPPPPPQATGVIHTDKAASTPKGDALTEIALTLLRSVLSLI